MALAIAYAVGRPGVVAVCGGATALGATCIRLVGPDSLPELAMPLTALLAIAAITSAATPERRRHAEAGDAPNSEAVFR